MSIKYELHLVSHYKDLSNSCITENLGYIESDFLPRIGEDYALLKNDNFESAGYFEIVAIHHRIINMPTDRINGIIETGLTRVFVERRKDTSILRDPNR